MASGAGLGLDPEWAYWEVLAADHGLPDQLTYVSICGPITLQGGDVLMESSECENLDRDAFAQDGGSLFVPVAPSTWLTSEPSDGAYYRELHLGVESGPIFDC